MRAAPIALSLGRSARGFTLVEILIVMVIVGVMVGTAAYALNGTEQHRLRSEASNLVTLLNHLVDQSLMKQQTLGLTYDPKRNRCTVLKVERDGEWHAVETGKAPCTFKVISTMALAYPGIGPVEREEREGPDIVFYPSAEYVPFTLTLSSRSGRKLNLSGDGINTITLEQGQP